MLSQATIKKLKLDTASLKSLFTAEKPKKGIKALIELVADRQREGKLRCLTDYRVWHSVDLAYDATFSNSQATVLRHILGAGGDEKQTLESLRDWGLNPSLLFTEIPFTESNGTRGTRYEPNYPMFFNVTIPLVRAYLTIRLANIFNERNVTPLFDYQPLKYNAKNRVLCEILTSLTESIATDYAYPATLRKWIFNALMYSVSIKFPLESWDEQKTQNEDGDEEIVKQGIRYIVPHVSQIYYDLNYPLHTLNTGTGCSYAGYWTVMRWGEIANNSIYWNRDNIPHGTNWLAKDAAWYSYFKEIQPCTLDFPMVKENRSKETNREKNIGRYGRGDYDSAFFIGYQFVQLVPSDWDLGDYDNKVWFKFTIGADDVIMFAQAFGYRPVDYIGYDDDDGRSRNASLAQEIQPSQEMASNTIAQYLSTIKRNLTNITFYNKEAVNEEQIKTLDRRSQSQYQRINMVGFDGLQMEKAGVDMANIFKNVNFTPANTSEILTSFNTIIAILERTLVISAQEVGGAASHQQGNKEIEAIADSSTNRVSFTASRVDEGIDAWKRQIVEAAMCNMSTDDVEAQISVDIPNLDAELEAIGFERVEKDIRVGQKTVTVKGKLSKLKLTQFLSRRADKDRTNDMAAAQAMMACVSSIANNQFLSSVVNPQSLVDMLQLAARLAGADDDFKLTMNEDAVVAQQVQKVSQEIQQQIMAAVEKQVAEPAATAIAQTGQKTDQNTQDIQSMIGVLEKLQQMKSASSTLPTPLVSTVIPPNGAPPAPPVPQVA